MTRSRVLVQSVPFDAGRWAAEELALQLGWLCECPYHGEPFRSPGQHDMPTQGAAHSQRQPDYSSDTYSLALQLSSGYSESCPVCTLESAVPE